MFIKAFDYITKCTTGIEVCCGFHMESNYHDMYIKKVFEPYVQFFNSNFVCCFLSRSVPESDHSFGNTSNGGVNGEKVPPSREHLEEIDPDNDSDNSPSSFKVMAAKVPIGHNEGHTLSLPKLRSENNIDSSTSENLEYKKENLSPENVLDNIQENHQLHNTQSMPVWMPSVVATTVSEDAEEQTFDNIGKISLGQLKVEVNDIYGMGIFLANF